MAVTSDKFPKRIIAAVSLIALFACLILIVIKAVSVLLMIFAGVLLALLLSGLAKMLQKYLKLSHNLALFTVIIVLTLLTTGLILILGPGIADGVSNLQQKIPAAVERLKGTINQFGWGNEAINNLDKKFDEYANDPDLISKLMGVFSSTIGVVASLLVIIVIGLYLAFDPDLYIRGIIRLIPKKGRKHGEEILISLGHALKWWMVGQFSSMMVVGILTFIGLLILNIPLAFTLAFIAFAFSFVPNIGPVASAIPAILVGLMDSPLKALYVTLLYIAVQLIESYLITPIIQQRTVSMPPALLISTQILVGVFLGVFGLLLATPLMVVVIVLVQKLYVDDALGDKVKALGE